MNPAIEQKIAECWHSGASIKETIRAVHQCHGTLLTFAEVHSRFVALSWGNAA